MITGCFYPNCWRQRSRCPAGITSFYCAQDVKIKESLIQNLIRYNYRNHLAHVYIYAYDNKPEIVKKCKPVRGVSDLFQQGNPHSKKSLEMSI